MDQNNNKYSACIEALTELLTNKMAAFTARYLLKVSGDKKYENMMDTMDMLFGQKTDDNEEIQAIVEAIRILEDKGKFSE